MDDEKLAFTKSAVLVSACTHDNINKSKNMNNHALILSINSGCRLASWSLQPRSKQKKTLPTVNCLAHSHHQSMMITKPDKRPRTMQTLHPPLDPASLAPNSQP